MRPCRCILVLLLLATLLSTSTALIVMTWAAVWSDILSGGPRRWKVDHVSHKAAALERIKEFFDTDRRLKILCPLAGDDPFVHYAWSQGHDVTAIDLVPAAVAQMRQQFDEHWTSHETEDSTVWKHASGRATLYVGDMLQKRPELHEQFDAVYDKDSFGALPLDLRQAYCQRLAEYCKPNAVVYTEVKVKEAGRAAGGPPFHVEKEDLMEATSFGTQFEHVEALGEIYPLEGFAGSTQTGHILKRK